MKPTIAIHNAETNEIEIREMTDEELKLYKKNQKESQEEQAAFETKMQPILEARKSAIEKLAALGLTADEIAALAG